MTRTRAAIVLALLLLGACAYPTRNAAITDPRDIPVNDDFGYRFDSLQPNDPADTLVIVTASGGGTRAATLALSVLEGMDRVKLDANRSLADRIDVLSSVSGGS